MARNVEFAPGEFYHLYNRGTEKRKIFTEQADYERFLVLLYLCNSNKAVRVDNLLRSTSEQGSTLLKSACEIERGSLLVDVGAYCLMPNHFHLLVREVSENGVSRFMQKLMTAYTMYFNKKYERNGALFQGKFKAEHAGHDRYLNYLLSYIHLNPISLIDPQWKENGIFNERKAMMYLDAYEYSSYLDFCGKKRDEEAVLTKNTLPEYFKTARDFKKEVQGWLLARSNLAQGASLK